MTSQAGVAAELAATIEALREQQPLRVEPVRWLRIEALARRSAGQPGAVRERLDNTLRALVAEHAAALAEAERSARTRAAPAPDASMPGASMPDASMPDASMPDASTPDASMPDASMPDASMPDASMPDASMPDALTPDASTPDASTPGSPSSDTRLPRTPACGTARSVTALRALIDALSANAAREIGALGPAAAEDADDVAAGNPHELRTLRRFRDTWTRLSAEQQLRRTLEQVPAQAGPLNSPHLLHRALQRMQATSSSYLQHFVAHVDALLWLEGLVAPRAADPPAAGKRRHRE